MSLSRIPWSRVPSDFVRPRQIRIDLLQGIFAIDTGGDCRGQAFEYRCLGVASSESEFRLCKTAVDESFHF